MKKEEFKEIVEYSIKTTPKSVDMIFLAGPNNPGVRMTSLAEKVAEKVKLEMQGKTR